MDAPAEDGEGSEPEEEDNPSDDGGAPSEGEYGDGDFDDTGEGAEDKENPKEEEEGNDDDEEEDDEGAGNPANAPHMLQNILIGDARYHTPNGLWLYRKGDEPLAEYLERVLPYRIAGGWIGTCLEKGPLLNVGSASSFHGVPGAFSHELASPQAREGYTQRVQRQRECEEKGKLFRPNREELEFPTFNAWVQDHREQSILGSITAVPPA